MALQEAAYWTPYQEDKVFCQLCPRHCIISPGKTGTCRVRQNIDGKLYSLNYARISSIAVDPIEKKPLYHFYPGANILSVGSFGCNLQCQYCQNYSIAHQHPPTRMLTPAKLAILARECMQEGSVGVAFTYNEPSIWYEYIRESAEKIKQQDLQTVMVSNGYIEKEPLRSLMPYIDAWNIDLKAFNPEFYKTLCKGDLEMVKSSIEELAGKTHLEITTLIIPGWNDKQEEIKALAHYLADLDPAIVLHLSAYFPTYKLEVPPPSREIMMQCKETAQSALPFVYVGNMARVNNDTLCKYCGEVIIERQAYRVQVSGIKDHHCIYCGQATDYIRGL